MFKLALILEMIASPDSDDIQNLFLDNRFLVDLLFSVKNLELLLEFSKTLVNLKATERGTVNYTKVMDALRKMKFCDFLLHCISLNINEVDQSQIQKKLQLVQNCWKLVDRGKSNQCTFFLYLTTARRCISSSKRFSGFISQVESNVTLDDRFSTRCKGSVC